MYVSIFTVWSSVWIAGVENVSLRNTCIWSTSRNMPATNRTSVKCVLNSSITKRTFDGTCVFIRATSHSPAPPVEKVSSARITCSNMLRRIDAKPTTNEI
ncbi:unnamed protein product [Nesidiocoris tenuis]|uniref:Uncharacterized protein n=1 Tax=Nesidiocoris tenuis TaxID=355587 RepID=A0A6H5HJU9_9HEMI|nr:unnamed protein product [Nesidiocoris tenuis]